LKLALDTTQTSGSLALWKAGSVVYSAWFNISITHSETLMPQIDHALAFCGCKPSDLKTLLLAIGPGSFTGLRIGLATAKGIAFGLKIPLLAFNSLQMLAWYRYNCGRKILAVIDAKMKEVYAALYDENLGELNPPQVCSPEQISGWDLENAFLLGSGAPLVEPLLRERGIGFTPVPHQVFTASALFGLAELFPQTETYDFEQLAKLEPLYLRDSTAQVGRR